MAYNRENLMAKAIRIYEIYKEKSRQGLSKKEIYWKYIHPDFHISKRTFSKYLDMIGWMRKEKPKQKEL